MLTVEDKQYIACKFNVYDHNYQFYEELLGSVCLIEDVIAYCDGAGLYIAAFSLEDSQTNLAASKIQEIIDKAWIDFSKPSLKFINVWGRFSDLPPVHKLPSATTLDLVEQSAPFEMMFDSVYDLYDFDANTSHHARKRIRQRNNSPLVSSIIRLTSFGHEHLALIEEWIQARDISPIHKEFFFTLNAYIKKSNVLVCEARHNNELVGFSIIGIVSNERMVLHSAFPLRREGLRVGDALFLESLAHARQNNIRWLHCGYSASKSLLSSKEEWGAVIRSPSYREAFYSADSKITKAIAEGKFLWRMRIASSQ